MQNVCSFIYHRQYISGFFRIRQIIAAIHFNDNLKRDVRKSKFDGSEQISAVYPKFKNGEVMSEMSK